MTLHIREYTRADGISSELCFCAGPETLGQTGDGSLNALFGSQWHARWQQDGLIALAQETPSGWMDRINLPFYLPDTARHITLAFDQVAKWVLAWEIDGQIYLREESSNLTRGPFPGRDPLLINDAVVSRVVAGSDVCLFYASQDRTTLSCRLQRDAYLLPEDYHTYPEPTWLDQVIVHPFEIEIRSSGDAVISSFYPIQSTEAMAGAGRISSGAVESLNSEYAVTDSMTGSGLIASGNLEDLYTQMASDSMTGSGAITGGNVDLAYTRTHSENMTGTGLISSGLREEISIERTHTESITGSGFVSSGLVEGVGIEHTSTEALSGEGGITGGSLA